MKLTRNGKSVNPWALGLVAVLVLGSVAGLRLGLFGTDTGQSGVHVEGIATPVVTPPWRPPVPTVRPDGLLVLRLGGVPNRPRSTDEHQEYGMAGHAG